MWLQVVFLICLVFGGLWLLLTAFLGDFLGTDVDSGDFDVDGDVDFDANLDFDLDGGGMHLGPFSPMILACFLATFGGSGMIITLSMPEILHIFAILPAALVGLGSSGGLIVIFNHFAAKVEGSSECSLSRLAGRMGRVTVSIPVGGGGEVAVVVKGSRTVYLAITTEMAPIRKGAKVVVDEVQGTTLVVSLHPDEKLARLGASGS